MTRSDQKTTIQSEKDGHLAEKLRVIFSLMISAALISALLVLISENYKPLISTANIKDVFELTLSAFRPEPVERMQFVAGIISLPFLLIAVYLATGKYIVNRIPDRVIEIIVSLLYPALFIILILFLTLHQNALIYTTINPTVSPVSLIVLFLLSYCCCNFTIKEEPSAIVKFLGEAVTSVAALLALLAVSLVCLYGVIDLRSITASPIYIYSFNAVFHAVVQVFLGKEILVDFVHQYGLYPHLIEPVFRITGLSVLSFSIFMSILNGISLLSIYLVMRAFISSGLILFMSFVLLIFYCYFFGRLINLQEIYYQYHPVRFIFPALSIFCTYLYLKSRDIRLYYLSFVLYSVAMLWNLDSGFVVFLSWLLLLIYLETVNLNFRKIFMHLATGAVTASAVIACFSLYLRARYGHFPDFAWAFDYQQLFYISGYFMLPMKIWHPWMVVMGIYAAGLLDSLKYLLRKKTHIRSAMFFFLSILGIGLFSYYQGRSHDLNLPTVAYPAVIIFAIYLDTLIEQVKLYSLKADKICLVGLLFVCMYLNFSLLYNTLEISSIIISRIKPLLSGEETAVSREFDFIRANTIPREGILTLTLLSGVHSLAAQSPCPLKIPGITELILKSDYSLVSEYLDKKATTVIADGYYVGFVNRNSNNLFLYLANPEKNIFIFRKKP